MADIQQIFRAFEKLIAQILEVNGAVVSSLESPLMIRGFDFAANFAGERWAVEIKFYRTSRAQLSLLESAAVKLVFSSAYEPEIRPLLIVSCLIDPSLRSSLQERHGIVVADRSDLFVWARKKPEIFERLTSMLEPEESIPPRFVGRPFEEVLRSVAKPFSPPRAADFVGTRLCEELGSLTRGNDDWATYEKLCERILRYLFEDDLQGWHTQKRTDDGLNRFDFVCRIRPTTEFWKFLLHHLNSRYVLFEFKNYAQKIGQGQVLTTEKYLLEKGLRRVAIIMTRSGCDEGAKSMTQGAMREHGKLILVVSDDEVCEMLHMKEVGDDPSDLLFEIADNFLLKLPR
jgi:hypothetical protein